MIAKYFACPTPDFKEFPFRCKEQFLYHQLRNVKTLENPTFKYGAVWDKTTLTQVNDLQRNIPVKHRAVFEVYDKHVTVTVCKWWDSYYKLGWLALLLRIYSKHETFTNVLKSAFENFVNGQFTQPKNVRMDNYRNWRHYFLL